MADDTNRKRAAMDNLVASIVKKKKRELAKAFGEAPRDVSNKHAKSREQGMQKQVVPTAPDDLMADPDAELGPALHGGVLPPGTTVKDYYTRPDQLARFIGWSLYDLVELLFFDHTFLAGWRKYFHHVVLPRLKGAKESLREINWQDVLQLIEEQDILLFFPGIVPNDKADSKTWTRFVIQALRYDCKMFTMSMMAKDQIRWTYMVLKCREHLQCNPDMKEELLAAHHREKSRQRAYEEEDEAIREMRKGRLRKSNHGAWGARQSCLGRYHVTSCSLGQWGSFQTLVRRSDWHKVTEYRYLACYASIIIGGSRDCKVESNTPFQRFQMPSTLQSCSVSRQRQSTNPLIQLFDYSSVSRMVHVEGEDH